MVPGHARHNYEPWVESPVDGAGDFRVHPRKDATRYMPGHPSYVGIAALHEGLKFIDSVGVENALQHSVALNARLLDALDSDRFPCISPHPDRSPILTLTPGEDVGPRLRAAGIGISLGPGRMRISPSVYNNEDDMDRLAAVLSES